jgi:hypothetical protein
MSNERLTKLIVSATVAALGILGVNFLDEETLLQAVTLLGGFGAFIYQAWQVRVDKRDE